MSKLIINVETGDIVERELNKAEQDQQKNDEAQIQEIQLSIKAEAEAKATARAAILNRLGLTSQEASLLLS